MNLKRRKTHTNKKGFAKEYNSVYREFSCDLCASTGAIELPYVRRYTKGQLIHICVKCGFIYVKRRRSYDQIAQVWSNELFGKAYTSRTPLMLARHTYIAEFIEQNIGLLNKKVCDIGAGEGQFLDIIKRNYGSIVFGIEPSAANCNNLRKLAIKYFTGTLEDYLKNSDSRAYLADVVTMMWTLENAASCRELLMSARKILKRDGHLIVATGSRILVPFSKPLNLYLSSNPVDTHAVRFSANTLTSLLATVGFKLVHVNPYLNDSLMLCVIAKKVTMPRKVRIKGDDFRQVRDYFKRWHRETLFYNKLQSVNTK